MCPFIVYFKKISVQIYEFILTGNRYFIRQACSYLFWVNSVSFGPFLPQMEVFFLFCFVLFCFSCMLSIGTYTRLPAGESSNLWNRPQF